MFRLQRYDKKWEYHCILFLTELWLSVFCIYRDSVPFHDILFSVVCLWVQHLKYGVKYMYLFVNERNLIN